MAQAQLPATAFPAHIGGLRPLQQHCVRDVLQDKAYHCHQVGLGLAQLTTYNIAGPSLGKRD